MPQNIEMHRINIEFVFKANFQIVSLLKIAPYHCQNLVDTRFIRIFAPAIEGNALGA